MFFIFAFTKAYASVKLIIAKAFASVNNHFEQD